MNIHFIFPSATQTWPLVRLLQARFPDATFDCGGLSGFGRYSRFLQLIARLPWLARYAFRSLRNRLNQDRPPPIAVCVGSDIELLGCLLARQLSGKRIPIILLGFIYTPRQSSLTRWLRWHYFRAILSQAAGVICYSRFESEFLPGHFRIERTPFLHCLFGGNLNIPKDLPVRLSEQPGYILSAGRSGRDYALLCRAIGGSPWQLHIICDSNHALKEVDIPSNVRILRNCHGEDYLREIAGADFVILPLKDEKISSGQMVLLDAMALGRAVAITRTPTSIEYGEHLRSCFYFEPGSVDAVREAVAFLYANPRHLSLIGLEGKRRYARLHSIGPFVESLAAALERIAGMAPAS